LAYLGAASALSASPLRAASLSSRDAGLVGAARDAKQGYVVAIRHGDEAPITTPLPARGHECCQNPVSGEVACIARRPGYFIELIDPRHGRSLGRVEPAQARHFYGHGAFSSDGRWLYTTENNLSDLTGVVGIYDATNGYRRVGEWASGGIGPHQIRLLGDNTLLIAHGGIKTHPQQGRTPLNIEQMAPSLTWLNRHTGEVLHDHTLGQRQLSIRHLDTFADQRVVVAMQAKGDAVDIHPLLATGDHQGVATVQASLTDWASLHHYTASVATLPGSHWLAATSPRGNRLMVADANNQKVVASLALADAAGLVAEDDTHMVVSSGHGHLWRVRWNGRSLQVVQHHQVEGLAWDNHLARLVI